MAEIIRTHSTTSTQVFSRREPDGERLNKTTEYVSVRSIRCDRFDVSALRDLVATLDAAGVPDPALVEAEKSDVGHLVELRVMRVEVPAGNAMADNAPSSSEAPGGAE